MPLLDLSHPITDGMITYPGLPGPVISDHMSFEESRGHYAPDVEFRIGRVEMVANTGTYLDAPAHRYRDGTDIGGLALDQIAGVPGIVLRDPGPDLGPDLIDGMDITGVAVLFDTGWSAHWGSEAYDPPGHPHVTAPLALALVDARPAIVGIDSVNIDDTGSPARPAHSALLGAGIPIVEHLTDLADLPDDGFEFFAVPAPIHGMGSFPVRAFARW